MCILDFLLCLGNGLKLCGSILCVCLIVEVVKFVWPIFMLDFDE